MGVEEINIAELKKEILLGFHRQFAENQRIREQSFLKVIGFLGAVIVGYAYIFHRTNEYDILEISFIAILCEILLLFGCFVVLSIAYNFRRDQTINAKISEFAGVLGKNKIFPESYDPRKSDSLKNWYEWLPNYLANFFYIFPIIQLIIILSYVMKLKLIFSFTDANLLNTLTVMIGVFSIIATIIAYLLYYKKMRKFIDENVQNITSASTPTAEPVRGN